MMQTQPLIADHGYPRPQLVRDAWHSLNGPWDFASEQTTFWREPSDVRWESEITVPFAPETPASGVNETGFHAVCWYRRSFDAPALAPGARLILHFGAVDYAATVWVNGAIVIRHEGGYTPFSADITDFLIPDGPQTVIVRADDDPLDLAKPRGKQDWQREPHAIWYPRTSGIWQTVWLEPVPADSIRHIKWTAKPPTLGNRPGSDRHGVTARRPAAASSLARRRKITGGRYLPRGRQRGTTAASPSPIPALTTTATNCSGARDIRR